jgi:hypothetical protein
LENLKYLHNFTIDLISPNPSIHMTMIVTN